MLSRLIIWDWRVLSVKACSSKICISFIVFLHRRNKDFSIIFFSKTSVIVSVLKKFENETVVLMKSKKKQRKFDLRRIKRASWRENKAINTTRSKHLKFRIHFYHIVNDNDTNKIWRKYNVKQKNVRIFFSQIIFDVLKYNFDQHSRLLFIVKIQQQNYFDVLITDRQQNRSSIVRYNDKLHDQR